MGIRAQQNLGNDSIDDEVRRALNGSLDFAVATTLHAYGDNGECLDQLSARLRQRIRQAKERLRALAAESGLLSP